MTPVYEKLKGWKCDTSKAKVFLDLPTEAQSYVKFVEKFSNKEVSFVSTSADEELGMLRTRLN